MLWHYVGPSHQADKWCCYYIHTVVSWQWEIIFTVLRSTHQDLQLFSILHKRFLLGASRSRVCTYMVLVFIIKIFLSRKGIQCPASRVGKHFFSRNNNNLTFCTQETTNPNLCSVLKNGREELRTIQPELKGNRIRLPELNFFFVVAVHIPDNLIWK
jgi:hypothetical protein